MPVDETPITKAKRKSARKCNELGGKRWLQNSISVWSDIRKSRDELQLKHPALFPLMLVDRLIETFMPPEGERILDPFAGVGSTLIGAVQAGKVGVGFELSPEFTAKARQRLAEARTSPAGLSDAVTGETKSQGKHELHQASSAQLLKHVATESIDLCLTSPPYWNILNQKRTADAKDVRHYGNLPDDLGTIADYPAFLSALTLIFRDVLVTLKPGAYCCIVLMDLRKKNHFYPFHSDLAARLVEVGYAWDDLIIWNRQSEYNNLRPLGYPAVFRVNKVHEYVLLMQKPKVAKSQKRAQKVASGKKPRINANGPE